MVGLYFMSNFRIPSRLGQFGVKLMELRKLQFGTYLEHHCKIWISSPGNSFDGRIKIQRRTCAVYFEGESNDSTPMANGPELKTGQLS
jgi:hypothetical protein